MKTRKQFLSLLAALSVLTTATGVTAFAADEAAVEEPTSVVAETAEDAEAPAEKAESHFQRSRALRISTSQRSSAQSRKLSISQTSSSTTALQ